MCRLDKALDTILIKTSGEIKSRLKTVSFGDNLDGTSSLGYCHCLKADANGNLRLLDLIEFLDEKIVDYAIPKKEIDDAKKHMNKTNSASKILNLRKKAKGLFVDLEKTGEGGEILLYILIEEFLGIPQLISKMSLKTSGKLHYQGADGIHVKYDDQINKLVLYWCEAKMYQKKSEAISKCLESIEGFLIDPQSGKSTYERDIQLINSNIHQNINNEQLEDALVGYFDKDNILSNEIIFSGICFIGFDSKVYPNPPEIVTDTIVDNINKQLKKWYNNLSKKIQEKSVLSLKELHFFLMPFPSVQEFRDYYLKEID